MKDENRMMEEGLAFSGDLPGWPDEDSEAFSRFIAWADGRMDPEESRAYARAVERCVRALLKCAF